MRAGVFKWVLAVGLAGAGVKACLSRADLADWLQRHRFHVPGFERALPCEVYLLETNRWLEFEILKEAPRARLISNASISGAVDAGAGQKWSYALEYELSGARSTRGVYHFKSGQLLYLDKQTGRPVDVNFYLDRNCIPLGGVTWFLNLEDVEYGEARRLRLRLHSKDPEILGVAIRVYCQTRVPERKSAYLWSRLSDDQKRDLSRGNVYGFEGLTAQEKAFLLRFHWAVAAPEGIPHRDYERRTLYVREDSQMLTPVRDWTPLGIYLDPDHCAVLPLTNAPGFCTIQMVATSPPSSSGVISNSVIWRKDSDPAFQTSTLTWHGTNESILFTNCDALLELYSSRTGYVRAFQVSSCQTNEITPDPVQLQTFTCASTHPVDYAVEHIDRDPTPFRLDLRRLPDVAAGIASGEAIRISLLDAEGRSVQESTVVLTNMVSRHDWFVTTNGLTSVSMPQSVFFLLPHPVRALRVACAGHPVLVNAYTRPYHLPKSVRVPEDYLSARAFEPEQPTWFTVRPPDHVARRLAGETALVQVQSHLPEVDPRLRSGQYSWDSFPAQGDVRGHLVLIPQDENQALRSDSLGFTYFPLRLGAGSRIELAGEPWQPEVSPTLLLICTNGNQPAKVVVDGQPAFNGRLDLPVTQVRLGSLVAGAHHLQVDSEPGTSACLNYLQHPEGTAYLQRFCVMAQSNTLSFVYDKKGHAPELLALRLFAPAAAVAGTAAPCRVTLKLSDPEARGTGPFNDLTILERQAEVKSTAGRPCWLVAGREGLLHDSEPVFFPVGSDFPPGRYTVEVRVAASSPRWICLSRTTPGEAEKLTILSQHR